jgi:hypothetical protein
MIGEANDDGLDLAVGDELAELVELQHALHGTGTLTHSALLARR